MTRIVFDEIADPEDAWAVWRLDVAREVINDFVESAELQLTGNTPPRIVGIPIVWPNVRLGEN